MNVSCLRDACCSVPEIQKDVWLLSAALTCGNWALSTEMKWFFIQRFERVFAAENSRVPREVSLEAKMYLAQIPETSNSPCILFFPDGNFSQVSSIGSRVYRDNTGDVWIEMPSMQNIRNVFSDFSNESIQRYFFQNIERSEAEFFYQESRFLGPSISNRSKSFGEFYAPKNITVRNIGKIEGDTGTQVLRKLYGNSAFFPQKISDTVYEYLGKKWVPFDRVEQRVFSELPAFSRKGIDLLDELRSARMDDGSAVCLRGIIQRESTDDFYHQKGEHIKLSPKRKLDSLVLLDYVEERWGGGFLG